MPVLPVGISLFLTLVAVYRLFFHPLARFPGTKLAALTTWYEFYYDCILPGRFFVEIEKMHCRYGMDVFGVACALHPYVID
jgi:hypothetical protein